jgi:hypothetical protein
VKNIPHGMKAFDLVDSKKEKGHDTPHNGQLWVQLHDRGLRIVTGRVIGLQIWQDVDGKIVNWKAWIWDGAHTPFAVTKGEKWRAASDWHAAPADWQDDPNVIVAQLSDRVAQLEKQLAALGARMGTMPETLPKADLESTFAEIGERLDKLEAGSTPAPSGLPAAEEDPVAAMASGRPPAADSTGGTRTRKK